MMVQIEKDKIKIEIEIETRSPIDDLQEITECLLNLLGSADPDLCNTSEIRPAIILLKAMQPNFEQLKKAYR